MSDPVWRRDEADSPCVKICVVHPATGLCLGCHRTEAEIADWARMTPEAREAVLALLPARAAAAKPARRGGRARRTGAGKG